MARKDTRPRFRTLDELTGEMGMRLVQEKPRRGGPPKQQTGGRWGKLYLDELWRLTPLSARERLTLDWLLTHMEWNLPLRFRNVDIANDLSLKTSHISLYLRRLREIGIILEPTPRTFWINPLLAWLGGDTEREALIKELGLSSTLDGQEAEPDA